MENINNNETELNEINESIDSVEEVVQHTDEEKDFLNSLDDGDETETDSTAPNMDESLLLAQGEMTGIALLSAGEGLMKQFGHKDFALDAKQKENVSKSFAPLFVKHGGELPPWVLQFKEEIMFTFAFGSLCLASYSQIKALKKVDAEKVVNKEPEKPKQTEQVETADNATN